MFVAAVTYSRQSGSIASETSPKTPAPIHHPRVLIPISAKNASSA